MDHTSHTTTDHATIRSWIETRGGRPAIVSATESDGSALLRVDFSDPDEELEEISWEEFFRIFDEHNLQFLYQEHTADGGQSRFCKFVRNE